MVRQVTVVISAQDSFSTVFSKYSDAIKQAKNDTSQLATGADSNKSAFEGLLNTVNRLALAYLGVRGAQMVGELYALGQQANRTEAVFQQLTSTMGGYAVNMAAMRAATGGIVDDMTLQQGANKLLQMGLAETTGELSRLTEMAIKLGGSMGMDVTKSMSDFSLMLANNSVMRLDQFGISSGEVRQKMRQLKETMEGIDRSEAFKLAVLEIGEKALDRLGMAAAGAETPLARLETKVQNLIQDLGQGFAQSINGLTGILEIAAGQHPIQIQQREELTQLAGQILPGVVQGMGAEGDLNFINEFINRFLTEAASDPEIASHAAEVGARIFQNMGGEDAAKNAGLSFSETFDNLTTYQSVFELMTQSILQVKEGLDYTAASAGGVSTQFSLLDSIVKGMDTGTTSTGGLFGLGGGNVQGFATAAGRDAAFQAALAQRSAREYAGAYYSAYTDFWAEKKGDPAFMSAYTQAFTISPEAAQIAANRSNELMQEALGQKIRSSYALRDFMSMGGDLSVGDYATQARADQLAAQYEEAEQRFERLKAMNAQGLISDEDLSGASDFKDRIKEAADNAERAAKAFENMKLSDVFGQTSGGLMGQMTDDLVKRLKDSGATDEQIAAVQRGADLASGRQTGSSTVYEDQVMPMIEQLAQIDPQMAVTALGNLQTFMQQAKLLGMSDEQIAANMTGALGVTPGGAGGQFTVSAGQSAGQIMGQTGLSLDQLLAITGAANARTIQTGTYDMGGGYQAQQGFDIMAYINAVMSGGGQYGSGGMMGRSGAQAGSTGFGTGIGFGTGMMGGGDKEGAGGNVDPLVTMQEGIDTVAEKARGAGDEFTKIREVIGEANTDMEELVSSLDQIPAFHEMKIKFVAEDPYGIIAMIQALQGGSTMGDIVQSNGGTVPGTPPQASNGTGGGRGPY